MFRKNSSEYYLLVAKKARQADDITLIAMLIILYANSLYKTQIQNSMEETGIYFFKFSSFYFFLSKIIDQIAKSYCMLH